MATAPKINSMGYNSEEAEPNYVSINMSGMSGIEKNIEKGKANAAARNLLLKNIQNYNKNKMTQMLPTPSAPPLNSELLKPYLMTIKQLRNQIKNTNNASKKEEITKSLRNAIQETRGLLRGKSPNLVGNFSNEDKMLLEGIRSNLTYRNIGIGGKRKQRKSRKASRRRLTRRRR